MDSWEVTLILYLCSRQIRNAVFFQEKDDNNNDNNNNRNNNNNKKAEKQ